RPGVTCESVDAAARGVIESGGCGALFIHRTGHGIGMSCHEDPYIVRGNAQELVQGMAFSDEPGIYREGRYGVRIESILVVTRDGAEELNEPAPASLQRVGA
ncbi:MAG TPA: M24 family metallopeptidase, partial [Chthonomonadales bacterium]|nr:M24 family metallopeptidase [Chthonomonadales bacterium]